MAKERIDSTPREIKFGGELKAEEIKRGFAFTTLRNPRAAYDFHQGEVILADCFESGEKVPVVVLSNETKKLIDFSIPQLALDGFFSPQQARTEMRAWKGYEKTTTRTRMQAITLVSKETYDQIPQAYKNNFKGRSFNNLIFREELRHLFFPTMCLHFLDLGGDADDWNIIFLHHNGLITPQQSDKMMHYMMHGHDISRVMKDHPDLFRKVAMDPKNDYFRPLVLGIFEEE